MQPPTREAHGTLSTLTVPQSEPDALQQIEGISVGLNPNLADRHPFIDHKKTYFAPRFGLSAIAQEEEEGPVLLLQ